MIFTGISARTTSRSTPAITLGVPAGAIIEPRGFAIAQNVPADVTDAKDNNRLV